MRQSYQNKRARGRSRKGPNPLTKTFESNGPDVKIRGTASHIAEKYTSLARDAQSSGDTIQAENYMQHAEHYLRIIAAAQPQQQPSENRPDVDDDAELDEAVTDAAEQPTERRDRGERGERGDRNDRRRGNERGGRNRRPPYRAPNGDASDDRPVLVADANPETDAPQPYVDAMLPKPANSALNGEASADLNGHKVEMNGSIDTSVSQPDAPTSDLNGSAVRASTDETVSADMDEPKPAPRRRGRPPKAKAEADASAVDGEKPAPRRRGRPPKVKPEDQQPGDTAEA